MQFLIWELVASAGYRIGCDYVHTFCWIVSTTEIVHCAINATGCNWMSSWFWPSSKADQLSRFFCFLARTRFFVAAVVVHDVLILWGIEGGPNCC